MLKVNQLIGFGGKRSSSAVIPADIMMWFRGEDLTGSNGDPVTTWLDHTLNANDATSGTGITLDTTGLNSINVVDCQGLNSPHLILPTSLSTGLTQASTFFVAKKDDDPPLSATNSGGVIHGGTANFNSSGDHYPFTDSSVYCGWGSTVRKTVGNPSTSLATWHIGCFTSASGEWSYYLNGIQVFTTATNTFGFTGTPGLFYTQTISWFDGKCAEILMLNTSPVQARREQIEGYLAHRFAITSVLDAGHPYKSTPPSWP